MDELKAKIAEALQKLDSGNDAHWNKDGTPAVAYIGILVGGGATKELVAAVADGFNRDAAKAKAAATPAVPETAAPATTPAVTGETAPTAPAAPVAAPEGVATQEPEQAGVSEDATWSMDLSLGAMNAELTLKSEPDDYEGQLRELDDALANLAQARDQVNALITSTQAKRDVIVLKAQAEQKMGDGTTDYLRAQQKHLEVKAARVQAMRGVNVKEILAQLPQPSKIDQALSRRTRGR